MTGASSALSVRIAEVAAVVDVQPVACGHQPRDHPGVDQRDDRVVVAGQHQHGLPEERQPRQARPAGAGEQLE